MLKTRGDQEPRGAKIDKIALRKINSHPGWKMLVTDLVDQTAATEELKDKRFGKRAK